MSSGPPHATGQKCEAASAMRGLKLGCTVDARNRVDLNTLECHAYRGLRSCTTLMSTVGRKVQDVEGLWVPTPTGLVFQEDKPLFSP